MAVLNLEVAEGIIAAAIGEARQRNLQPLAIAVVDSAGSLKAFKREDDDSGSTLRPQIAIGKAVGAVGIGQSSRRLGEMATERPHFVNALVALSPTPIVPVPGGVLVKDAEGWVLGAVGVSGDSSDNDETVACAGIEAVGLGSSS